MINTISFPYFGWTFTINRVAFTVLDRPIFWYGIFILSAIIIGTLYVFKVLPKEGVSKDDISNMILYGIVSAIIGARAYYVAFSFDDYKHNLIKVFAIWEGGLAIYGGVIFAVLSVLIYCKWHKISALKILDALAVVLILGQAIGRWGNFFNAEAYGAETTLPFAMTIENNSKIIANLVHPTFLYESVWDFAGFLFLLFYKRAKFSGEKFFWYIVIYGAGRGFIEGLRVDSLMLNEIRVSQWLAFISAAAALITIICIRQRKKKLLQNSG